MGGDGSGTALSTNISDKILQHANTSLVGETVKVDTLAQQEQAKWEEAIRQDDLPEAVSFTSSLTNRS